MSTIALIIEAGRKLFTESFLGRRMDSKVVVIREDLRNEAQQYEALQKELQSIQEKRSRFIQQQQENIMVLEEMNLLDEEATVYKLIGPALIKQDPVEAKSNVETRLELIKTEQGRLEGQAKSIEEKRLQKEKEIVKLQEQLQRQAQAASQR